jgi:hypothetical protein
VRVCVRVCGRACVRERETETENVLMGVGQGDLTASDSAVFDCEVAHACHALPPPHALPHPLRDGGACL